MSPPALSPSALEGEVFRKDTLINGKPAQIECFTLCGQTFTISGSVIKVVSLDDEWYNDLNDPFAIVDALGRKDAPKADLLTFWQRIPDIEQKFPFNCEREDLAVLKIESFDHWWQAQIKSRVRNLIRKAEKEGVVVKEVAFDDSFVMGMTAIFNEAPFRQGRRFWHYGKDFETIKDQFSRHVFREHMLGAYYQGQMIGFMMLGDAGRFALTGQIISSIKHRDKAPNNALIAKAVEVCAARRLGYLIYLSWSDDSLAEFKRRCGFEKVSVPRYYVPLSWKGALVLKAGAHRGWKAMLPKGVKSSLKRFRRMWYARSGD